MAKRLKKDDLVKVITGKDKGKEGKVLELDHKNNRVVVEGINITKLHKKKTDKSEGGIIEVSKSIHQSNVALLCPEKKVITKIGFKSIKDGNKKRVSRVSGATF
jgi:large subunit ribosomal protein L24